MRRGWALLLACTSLAGCAVWQGRTVPVAPVEPAAAWRTDAGPTASVDAAWWQSFGDPALTALVEKAVANNTDILTAAARVREARANQRLARASLLPTLDAGFAGGRQRSVSAFGTPEVQNYAVPQVQASYEVDLFGRLADSASAARSAYLASQAARDSVTLAVASATAAQYITLLGLDARLAVAKDTLQARAESLRIARSRTDNGYSPRLELQQAQAEYDATAQIIPQIKSAIARTEDSLSQLTGDVPGPIARGAGLDALATPPIPGGLPSKLLERRPDIAQAANQLAAADKSLSAARKRFLPRLSLSGTAGATFSSLLVDPITVWSVGGSVLAPIFEAGRIRAGAEVAASQRDQAAIAYRRTVLTSFREVEDALASVKNLDDQMAYAQHQIGALQDALRLATSRYREGYSPYLEQLDAQRGLLSAQLALVTLESDALTARVQLYQAMGGGWSAAQIAAANKSAAQP